MPSGKEVREVRRDAWSPGSVLRARTGWNWPMC